jgi:ubiquitin-protein ligase
MPSFKNITIYAFKPVNEKASERWSPVQSVEKVLISLSFSTQHKEL